MSLLAHNYLPLPSILVLVSDRLGASNVSLLDSCDQQITVQFSLDDMLNTITFVYVNILSSSRHFLLQELYHIFSLVTDSWFFMGDFNACSGAQKKTSSPPSRCSCLDFIKTVEDCNLTCLDTKDPFFTWTNNRWGRDVIDIRLDRVLCNFASF